ncbi:unnamed protein product [Dicrocoelium dendriticum]|nr:unnamed protein product [Dicrocoelium dendriticum]
MGLDHPSTGAHDSECTERKTTTPAFASLPSSESSSPTAAAPLLDVVNSSVASVCSDCTDHDQIVFLIRIIKKRFERLRIAHCGKDCFETFVSLFKCVLNSTKQDLLPYVENDFGEVFSIAITIHPSAALLDCLVRFLHRCSQRYNSFSIIHSVLSSDIFNRHQQMKFVLDLSEWHFFDRDVLPNLGTFLTNLSDHNLDAEYVKYPGSDELITFLLRLCLARLPPIPEPCGLLLATDQDQYFIPHNTRPVVNFYPSASAGNECHPLVDYIIALAESLSSTHHRNTAFTSVPKLGWNIVRCLLYIRPLPFERVHTVLLHGMEAVLQGIDLQPSTSKLTDSQTGRWLELLVLVETACELLLSAKDPCTQLTVWEQFPITEMLQFASVNHHRDPLLCCVVLRLLDTLLCTRALRSPIGFEDCFVSSAHKLLLPCLLSSSHQIRLHTLRILAVIHGVLANTNSHSDFGIELTCAGPTVPMQPVFSVLSRCLCAERLRLDAQTSRELLIQVLHLHAERPSVRHQLLSAEIALHHLLGLLHISLSSAWPAIQEAIASYAEVPPISSEPGSSTATHEKSITSPLQPSGRVEEWRHIASRLYWTVMEPVMLRVSQNALQPPKHEDDVTLVPETEGNTLTWVDLQYRLLFLYCLQPNRDHLPFQCDMSFLTRPPNWTSYYCSLWRCLRPRSAGKRTRFLIPLFLQLFEFYSQRPLSRSVRELYLVTLELFSKLPNIKSIHLETQFRATLYEMLTNKRPDIQKAAFQCLLAYKNTALNTYKENFERIIDPRSFRDEIRTFKLDVTVRDPSQRLHVAPIYLRLLYGRLQASKSTLAPAILTNLASCSSTEFSGFLHLLLQPLLRECVIPPDASLPHSSSACLRLDSLELVDFIQSLRDRVRLACTGQDSLSWARLQAISTVLNHVLDYMGHRLGRLSFPDSSEDSGTVYADILLRLGLCLTAVAQTIREVKLSLTSGDEEAFRLNLPVAAQIKRIRSTGVRLLEHLFTSSSLHASGFWSQPNLLEAIRHVCFHPSSLSTLVSNSTLSSNHLLLSLALPWSTSSHLALNLLNGSSLEALLNLLSSPKINSILAERLLEIVDNLLFLPEVQQVGRQILQVHHSQLVRYLHVRLENLSHSKTLPLFRSKHNSVRLQREFRLLGYIATLSEDDTAASPRTVTSSEADHLIRGLLTLLTRVQLRFAKASHSPSAPVINSDSAAAARESQLATADAVEAELVRALIQLVQLADNFEEHLARILNLFSRLDSRICRGLLCQAVGAIVQRLPSLPLAELQELSDTTIAPHSLRRLPDYLSKFKDETVQALLEDILSRLNSWDLRHLDQPDSVCREYAFGILTELSRVLQLPDPPKYMLYLHLGGVNCALYTLVHNDLQLRDAALDYCVSVLEAVRSRTSIDSSWTYRTLILGCLWPGLLRLLRRPKTTESQRLHLLRLLTATVHHLRDTPRFQPLALLSDPETPSNDFYNNLQSSALTRQTHAIRRLSLFLHNPLTIVSKRRIASIRQTLQLTESAFVIPERDLRDPILPILQCYLNPQVQSSSDDIVLSPDQKHLLENSLSAMGALATRLSWDAYHKLLTFYLSRLKSAGDSTFAARLIITLIDSFRPPKWTATTDSNDLDTRGSAPVSELHGPGDSIDSVSIMNYMLSLVKTLQPYITKPSKDLSGNGGHSKSSKIFRISLASSLVSLLRRLPPGCLESQLPHIVLRVVDVLRPSPTILPKTRTEAVESLTRIGRMLGPGKNLDTLLTVVGQQLNRGYAAQQIRLFTLHRILAHVELAIINGEVPMKPGHMDTAGRIVSAFYLDELVGSLAEEMDSRRAAGQPLSSMHPGHSQSDAGTVNSSHLGGSTIVDLPEASGLKAPSGLARICRLLSLNGILRLFADIQSALSSAATGTSLLEKSKNTTVASTQDSSSVGCGLRFRNRAIARLEVALARLPTRNGMFSTKKFGCLRADELLKLAEQLIAGSIHRVLCSDDSESRVANKRQVWMKRKAHGWTRPCSTPLEPRWDYLGVDPEPPRELSQTRVQSELTQDHLLTACGLHILVGLLRYRWLKLNDLTHMKLLGACVPLILDCMRSKYIRVAGAALRVLNLLFVLASSKSSVALIPHFEQHLCTAGSRLFDLLALNSGLLSTKTAAADAHTQQFASNLYRALSCLVRHRIGYPLSRSQLLTLLDSVDIELTRDAATAPSLSLLQAILQRRLRDPVLHKEESGFLTISNDSEMRTDLLSPDVRLVVAKPLDKDHNPITGSGGGSRLLDLVERLQHLAITSPSDHIRAEARCCLVTFLLNYPHKAKFVQSFVAFCLIQLEHRKPTGRSSAVSLLTGLVSDLPIDRLTTNHLDEAILVSVGAAIEREPVRSIRVGMLAVLRLLFTRLPAPLAESYFRDYLIAFITAPVTTRCSARLLGLQVISSVLDCQPCLSTAACRNALFRSLGTCTIPSLSAELFSLVLTDSAVRACSGLNPLFESGDAIPTEELAAAQVAAEDAKWVSTLTEHSEGANVESPVHHYSDDDDVDDLTQTPEEIAQYSEEADHSAILSDIDGSSDEREPTHFEEADKAARVVCDDVLGGDDIQNQKTCKSAVENHYLLVACSLEHSLRLFHRLISVVTDDTDTEERLGPLTASATLTPVWRSLLGLPFTDESIEMKRIKKSTYADILKRQKQYATLFSQKMSKVITGIDLGQTSLLCSGSRGVRAWATRCLFPLLKLEVVANQTGLSNEHYSVSEAVGVKTKSALLTELNRNRSVYISLLQRLLQESLYQLEFDAKEIMADEWSDALIANLIQLAQLLHLASGRKSVLRLFRRANRIALDELNHRAHCYLQRTLTLKLITGLLLHLPHPPVTELSEMVSVTRVKRVISSDQEDSERKTSTPAYLAYLRIASRHLSREIRQRERLLFLSAANLPLAQGSEDGPPAARTRLAGIKLTKEQSARARTRRKRTQARLRRALMSGNMRPENAQHLIGSTIAARLHCGPDRLLVTLEATEQALAKHLSVEGRNLVQLMCSQSSVVTKTRQQAHRTKKATRAALGVAWVPPSPTSTSPALTRSKRPSSSARSVESGVELSRKRQRRE